MSNFKTILIIFILQPVCCNLVLGQQTLTVRPPSFRILVPTNPLGGSSSWSNQGNSFFTSTSSGAPWGTLQPGLPQGVTSQNVFRSTAGYGLVANILIDAAYLNSVTSNHDIPVRWVAPDGTIVTQILEIRLRSQQQSQTQTQTQTQTQQQWGQMQGRSRIRNDRGSVCILKTRFNPSSGKVEVIRNGVIRHNGFLNFTDKTRLNRRQKLRAYR